MTIFFQNNEQYSTSLDMAKFVDFDPDNSGRPSFLTSYVISKIRQISNYTTIKVQQKWEGAPDYVSYSRYQGSHLYWWVIMIFNNLLDFSEIETGMELKIPAISEVSKILSSIQSAQTSVENNKYEKISLYK